MLRRTPLYEEHLKLGGRIIEFAGYEMPVYYPSGIMEEHRRVRTKVGIFDLTHMGEIIVKGKNSLNFVNKIITNDLNSINTGQALYTAMCYENGGIIDDLLVYRFDDHLLLVVNAINIEKDFNWLLKNKIDDVEIINRSYEISLIAVQGPLAEKLLSKTTDIDLSSIDYYHFTTGKVNEKPAIISRTGYTGEDGFEIYIENKYAVDVWRALYNSGKEFDCLPVGLGARDTLRLEARYLLYGNDMDESTTPVEAGLLWVVKFDKDDFSGKYSILKRKEEGPEKRLIGFKINQRCVPRHNNPLIKSANQIGYVTSGMYSPILNYAIGLAYIDTNFIREEEFEIEISKKKYIAQKVKSAFYRGTVKSKH